VYAIILHQITKYRRVLFLNTVLCLLVMWLNVGHVTPTSANMISWQSSCKCYIYIYGWSDVAFARGISWYIWDTFGGKLIEELQQCHYHDKYISCKNQAWEFSGFSEFSNLLYFNRLYRSQSQLSVELWKSDQWYWSDLQNSKFYRKLGLKSIHF